VIREIVFRIEREGFLGVFFYEARILDLRARIGVETNFRVADREREGVVGIFRRELVSALRVGERLFREATLLDGIGEIEGEGRNTGARFFGG